MFGSDNHAPAHPAILTAITSANTGRVGAYGDDAWSLRAQHALQTIFETNDLDVLFVGTGGAANGLALSLLCPPWGAILALGDAHILADEGGGPEHFTSGARIIAVGAAASRLTGEHLQQAAARYPRANVHSPQPRVVTVTNLSENGLIYTPREILDLSAVCREHDWKLHMDGARFANAVVTSGASPADLTWRSGVDAVSFGLTKNGAVCAEALIVFGKARNDAAAYLRKRAGHLFSKQRFMAAQFVAMLENGLWLELAQHANAMAQSLAPVLEAAGCTSMYPVEGNEVFARIPKRQAEILKKADIGFYPWPPSGDGVFRFVTCWQTTTEDIAAVKSALSC